MERKGNKWNSFKWFKDAIPLICSRFQELCNVGLVCQGLRKPHRTHTTLRQGRLLFAKIYLRRTIKIRTQITGLFQVFRRTFNVGNWKNILSPNRTLISFQNETNSEANSAYGNVWRRILTRKVREMESTNLSVLLTQKRQKLQFQKHSI